MEHQESIEGLSELINFLDFLGAFTGVSVSRCPETMEELLGVLVDIDAIDEQVRARIAACQPGVGQLSALVDVFINDGILDPSDRRLLGLEEKPLAPLSQTPS